MNNFHNKLSKRKVETINFANWLSDCIKLLESILDIAISNLENRQFYEKSI